MDDVITGLALLLVLLFFYMLPTMIAASRHHRQLLAIGVLNFFLGWTLLGWIGALVWACTADVRQRAGLPVRGDRGER
jgi:hypothetical protein